MFLKSGLLSLRFHFIFRFNKYLQVLKFPYKQDTVRILISCMDHFRSSEPEIELLIFVFFIFRIFRFLTPKKRRKKRKKREKKGKRSSKKCKYLTIWTHLLKFKLAEIHVFFDETPESSPKKIANRRKNFRSVLNIKNVWKTGIFLAVLRPKVRPEAERRDVV